MGTQISLFDAQREASLDERFRAFHAANPQVFEALVRLAREAKARGRKRLGLKMLWERLRWELYVGAASDEEWCLNNSFTSRYSRLLMETCPDLAGLFETRELRTEAA